MMTDQELRDTIKAAQDGDLKARNKAIEACLPMTRTIVTKFASSVGREDLIEDMCQQAIFAEGKGGLARAIQLYNTERAEVFSTFAAFWIVEACRPLVLPSTITPDQHKARTRKERKNHKRGPKLAAAIAAGEISEGSVTDIVTARTFDPEQRAYNEDYDVLGVREDLHSGEEELTAMIDGNEKRARFMAALDDLGLEEKYVISALCGIHGAPKTHTEIGNQLGKSRLSVARIVRRATERLKKHPLCQATPLASAKS